MIIIAFIGLFILGISLGKNNLGNLFGTAVGTGMVQLKTASVLASIFVFLGAFISGSATTSSVQDIAFLKTPTDLLFIVLSATVVLEILSRQAIPTSIIQTVIGALIGWDIYYHQDIDTHLLSEMSFAWVMAPLIGLLFSFLLMKLFHFILVKKPISIIIRDTLIRIGLIFSGILAAYSLGANNTGTLIGPYLSVCKEINSYHIVILVCLSITLGFLIANKKVIKTISSRIFLLSPLEAFIVMLSSSISLLCFSSKELYQFLTLLHMPSFPLVPVPMTCVIIGSICGISVFRGGYGLHFSVLGRIITSWFLVPILSGCLCYSFLIISDILG